MRKKIFTFLLALAASVGLSWAASNDKLPGAFSVSGTKVVYFSKGNLQATTNDQGATWTWGFAENQWDYVGDNAANTSFDYWGGTGNGSYDLFGWIGASSALTDYRQYGIGSNYDFTDCGNTAGEDLKADWGSLMGSDWRTLTYDEWQYLINSNSRDTLRAYATVNGKTGLILLPDSWTSSSVALTITTANYTTNIISASDWSTLEEQGCVFLPAAGWRSDDSVGGVGEGGDYWSSSSPSGKQYDEGSAYCFFFDTDFSKQADGMHFNKRGRGYGLSVRLVSETAPGGSTPANSCGDGLTWELNAGVFTISYDGVGTGVMDDFDYNEHPAPWQSSKESITSVIIPDGVTRIGNNAFSGANNLASVSMGDDVVAIGNHAFEACNSLSSITLSSHVTTIGDYAFASLQSLTSIVLPSTVQSIGTSAFYDNQGLTSITCEGTTPPTLGQYVFGMIGNDATLYVPYGYAETYQGADSQWQALNIQVIGSGSASYPYCGDGLTWTYNDGVLTIIYDGVGTGGMLDYGNYNIYPWDSYKDDITSVIIPDGVTRIGNYAFANLINLASVSMGDDVVEIGYGGFWNCLSLQSITLGSHVTTIGEHAFGSNHALTSITLPNTLQTIGGSAFYDCQSLPTITIPSSVTSFGEYAFGMCEGLTSFTCEGTTPPTLGQDVFTMVPYHRPLYVPDGYVETYQGADSQWQKFDISIIPAPTPKPSWVRDGDDWDDATKTLTVNSNPGKQAYQSITEIQHVVINNSVTSMDSEVFRYCTGLTSVTIPNSVTSIGYQVFSGCTGLTSVTIPNGITSIPSSLFYNCSSLSDVTIPNSVTSIANSAFYGCTSLTDVTIPNSVTSIDMQAFKGCTGLTSVTIPNSVTSIEYFAFDGCTNVTDVYCYPLAADLTWNYANNSFKANKATQCHVFASELSAYQDKFGTSVRVTFVGDLPAPTPTEEQVSTNADPENPSYHYSTFFHSTQNYKLTNDGTQAFIADLSNNDLVLTEIAHGEQVIPANTAVILRKSGSADPVVLTPTEENGVSVNPNDNSLKGVDAETAITSIDGLTATNCYVLSGKAEYGVGFYRINSTTLKAHKAYVIYNGGQINAPKRMRFVFNEEKVATGVENTDASAKIGGSEKVIENGILYIIKNGVRYNVQGQIVK